MASYKIIIDHNKVASNLTDFPVYIDLANFPEDFWDTVTSGGGDIRCYDINDNELAREVVSCNTALKTGELHVKASLSSTVPTILKVAVDGTSTDYTPINPHGRNAVWSNGYVGVWHLENLLDSTGAGYDLTDTGSAQDSGILGLGWAGFASGKYLSAGNPPGLYRDNMDWTLSAWAKSSGDSRTIQVVVDHGYLADRGLGLYIQDGVWKGHGRGGYNSGILVVPDIWTYLVARSAPSAASMFVNGIDTMADWEADVHNPSSSLFNFRIGYQSKSTQSPETRYFGGNIDEVRLSEYVRTPEWILTEYNNQSSPTSFYTVEDVVQAPIAYSDGFAYIYENVGYGSPNSGLGFGYSYENVGYGSPNSGLGFGYSYENVGYGSPNSGLGFGYSYENVTLYVISNDNLLPPIIN